MGFLFMEINMNEYRKRLIGEALCCLSGAKLQLEGKFSKYIIRNELSCLNGAIENLGMLDDIVLEKEIKKN